MAKMLSKLSLNSIGSYVKLESDMSDDVVIKFDGIDDISPSRKVPKRDFKTKLWKFMKTYRCCFISLSTLIFSLLVILLLFIFLVIPIASYFFPEYVQFIFFLNFRRLPMVNYDDLYANGIKSIGRAYHIKGEQGQLGLWHVLPHSTSSQLRSTGVIPTDTEIEELMRTDNKNIILYCHGNSFDRTYYHRTLMYNRMSDMDYHVVIFDYRGYGDSAGAPTEGGIVKDAKLVYDHIKQVLGSTHKDIIVWGHSMGTGVATKVVSDLSIAKQPPSGLVLESPFNNLQDAFSSHPLSAAIFWMTPSILEKVIIKPLNSVGLVMTTDERIAKVTCPILILHAQDDITLPVYLARRLFNSALAAHRDVDYIEINKSLGFGHRYICNLDGLPTIISSFMNRIRSTSMTLDSQVPISKDYVLYTKPVVV